MTSNPLGPLNGNYRVGDSLDALGLTIVNGRMPGVSGIYFATTPFSFDPNSATGYVPLGGDSAWLNSSSFAAITAGRTVADSGLTIIGIHDARAPEPAAFPLVATGVLLIALGRIKRRLT